MGRNCIDVLFPGWRNIFNVTLTKARDILFIKTICQTSTVEVIKSTFRPYF